MRVKSFMRKRRQIKKFSPRNVLVFVLINTETVLDKELRRCQRKVSNEEHIRPHRQLQVREHLHQNRNKEEKERRKAKQLSRMVAIFVFFFFSRSVGLLISRR
jgi:hypothetical protein